MYLAKSSGAAGTVENVALSCRLCHQTAAELADCAPAQVDQSDAQKRRVESMAQGVVEHEYGVCSHGREPNRNRFVESGATRADAV